MLKETYKIMHKFWVKVVNMEKQAGGNKCSIHKLTSSRYIQLRSRFHQAHLDLFSKNMEETGGEDGKDRNIKAKLQDRREILIERCKCGKNTKSK